MEFYLTAIPARTRAAVSVSACALVLHLLGVRVERATLGKPSGGGECAAACAAKGPSNHTALLAGPHAEEYLLHLRRSMQEVERHRMVLGLSEEEFSAANAAARYMVWQYRAAISKLAHLLEDKGAFTCAEIEGALAGTKPAEVLPGMWDLPSSEPASPFLHNFASSWER